jgi:hypothetical protein
MSIRILMAVLAAVGLAACGSPQSSGTTSTGEATRPAAAPVSSSTPTPVSGQVRPPETDAEKVVNAMAAAPEAVSNDATVIDFDANMKPRTLKSGTNGWTCVPDYPKSPGVDPMCLDAHGMEWLQAYAEKRTPPADKLGFAYMLLGGSDATNHDPYAAGPAAGQNWIDTGPHVMILNIGNRFAGYPTTHDNTKVPYIMWPNTPYAHLMIPVK